MADYDSLELGGYYSEKYLKLSGEIKNNRAVGKIYDLIYIPYFVDESKVTRWPIGEDETNIYQVKLAPLSYSGDAVLTTEYLPDYIIRDKVYGVGIRATLTAGAPVYFTSEIPEADQGDIIQSILLPITIKPVTGYVTLSMYEDTEWSGGAAVNIGSWNREAAGDDYKTVVYQGPTVVTGEKGTELPWHGNLFGVASTNQSAGGGGGDSKNIIPLNKAKRYLYEVEASEDGVVQIIAEFAEI